MKHALVLERNAEASDELAQVLHWLGYVAAPVKTPDEALNVASAIKFDVIVTCTCKRPSDRRAFTGELKRAAPEAVVIMLADNNAEDIFPGDCPGVTAIIKRPASFSVLRNTLEFGIDGTGIQVAYMPSFIERRRQYT